VFFTVHDPTTLNRQGADVGTQYRSAVFYHNPEQRAAAERVVQELEREKVWDDPIVTEVTPFTNFFRAEEYHQNYYRKNPYAGYCMAGSGFLALAHTLARGEHIRVKLILERAGVRARRGLELFSHAAASVLAIAFAYYSVRLSWQSYVLHDVSTGNDAAPLWIPQLGMAAGVVIFAIAFVDQLVLELRGARPEETKDEEPAHVE